MPKKKKKVESLDSTMMLIQIDKFCTDFDKSMKKSIRADLKKAGIALAAVGTVVVGSIIFKNPLITSIGMGAFALGAIVKNTKDLIKMDKEITREIKKQDSHIVELNDGEDKTPEQVLDKDIITKRGEDFYSPALQAVIERDKNYKESEDAKKYREALEKQQGKTEKTESKIRLVENNNLSKEDAIEQLVYEIDTYLKAYNLPPMKIRNEEWDIFFEICFEFFKAHNMELQFYSYTSEICKYALSNVLLNGREDLTITDFINGVDFLRFTDIPKKTVEGLKNNLNSKLYKRNVINLMNYIDSDGRKGR